MTASDRLNPQQFPFLHGSDHEFGIGDMITSSMDRGIEPYRASSITGSAHTRSYKGTPYSSPLRSNNFFSTAADHAEMFGDNTYEVEPTGRYSPDHHDADMSYNSGQGPEHFRSTAPLRVVRKVSSAYDDE